jgi:hypothetical protein
VLHRAREARQGRQPEPGKSPRLGILTGTLMARGPMKAPRTTKAQARDTVSDPGLHMRAGDENRTRTISLGTRPERPLSAPACYSCTSGPPRCPANAPESGPVRTVCETTVGSGGLMINLRELDTGCEHRRELLDERSYAIYRGAVMHLPQISCRAALSGVSAWSWHRPGGRRPRWCQRCEGQGRRGAPVTAGRRRRLPTGPEGRAADEFRGLRRRCLSRRRGP